jgi:hypothetical protein
MITIIVIFIMAILDGAIIDFGDNDSVMMMVMMRMMVMVIMIVMVIYNALSVIVLFVLLGVCMASVPKHCVMADLLLKLLLLTSGMCVLISDDSFKY